MNSALQYRFFVGPTNSACYKLTHYQRLVCVRYCYDPVQRKKYKTVELIIQEADWVPSHVSPALKDLPRSPRLGVQIGYHERNLREQVKAAGGRWSAAEKLWRIQPEEVKRLGLESRVVKT